jgi:putative FmdB family regulatory protein
MPLYTWRCTKCDKVTERLQYSYDAPQEIKCEKCGAKAKKELHANPWKFGRLGM